MATSVLIEPQTGGSVTLKEGDTLKVINEEGGQVADLFGFLASDPKLHISAKHSRLSFRRVFPAIGDTLVANNYLPMLELISDTTAGKHDMSIAACSPEMYDLYGYPGHRSCQANLLEVAAEINLELPYVPQPINLFQYSPAQEDGTIEFYEAPAKQGEYVEFRAHQDIIVIVSACPADFSVVNNERSAPIRLEVSP